MALVSMFLCNQSYASHGRDFLLGATILNFNGYCLLITYWLLLVKWLLAVPVCGFTFYWETLQLQCAGSSAVEVAVEVAGRSNARCEAGERIG